MTRREKFLGILVLAILVGLGARSVHNRLNESYRRYANEETSLQDTLFQEELKVAAGLEAAGLLSNWRERSLPADTNKANVLYPEWLLNQMADAGLEELDKPIVDIRSRPDGNILTYTIRCEGSLEEVTEFLYRFYRAKHLHKIARMDFTPDEAGQTFDVAMTIEAWALQDSFNTDALAEGESNRLAYESLDKYVDAIVDRNIFATYTPPEEHVVDAQPPPFDHAEHAFATGVVESNGVPQVWIYVRTTGDKYWLSEGESFDIGDLECKIVKIDTRSIVFEAEGKQYTVKLGRNLREGQPLDSDQA